MIRLALPLSLLALGCATTELPVIESPVKTEGEKPIKGAVLVPTSAPKVPDQDHLLDDPFLAIEGGGFTVEGAWEQPGRVLLSMGGAPGAGGATWSLLDLDLPEPERNQKPEDVEPVEVFAQDGAPLRAFPEVGVLVLEGQSRDVVVSMETGELLPWKAELPDGEITCASSATARPRPSGSCWTTVANSWRAPGASTPPIWSPWATVCPGSPTR